MRKVRQVAVPVGRGRVGPSYGQRCPARAVGRRPAAVRGPRPGAWLVLSGQPSYPPGAQAALISVRSGVDGFLGWPQGTRPPTLHRRPQPVTPSGVLLG